MSAKYQQHPMEQKAEADIAAARASRQNIERMYFRWLEFWKQSNAGEPSAIQAFRAGCVETMEEMRRAAPDQSPREPARFRVSIGDHHAEVMVDQHAPPEYHQAMVHMAIAEVLRRAAPRETQPRGMFDPLPGLPVNNGLSGDGNWYVPPATPGGEALP